MLMLAVSTLTAFAQKDVKSEDRNITGFSGVQAGGIFRVYLKASGQESVRIETEGNIETSEIETEVRGGILHLGLKSGRYEWKNGNKTEIRVYVNYKEMNSIDVSGAAFLKSESPIQTSRLILQLSGASKACLDIQCDKLDAELSGASNFIVAGRATESRLNASGASDFEGDDLVTDELKFVASGASKINIKAEKSLSGSASGASKVIYSGSASQRSISTSGAAKVSGRN